MAVELVDDRYFGPAMLALADGRVFRGRAFGARKTVLGEVVFNTSMFGYQEILSDPSYTDQIVCLTATEIGNVGTNAEDEESARGGALALVIRSLSPVVSNWRSEQSLDSYAKQKSIPGLAEIDTRALTVHLRKHGAQMAALSTESDDAEALIAKARQEAPMEGRDLVGRVSTQERYTWDEGPWGEQELPPCDLHVVAYDFGIKHNILRRLRAQGIRTTVVPATTSLEELLKLAPDGIFLSNGPGDPAALGGIVQELQRLLATPKRPCVFGICLGHQLLCLALGASTYKLKFGHHGGNHPVIDERTKKVAITAQNHGFAASLESLTGRAEMTHRNLFDDTVAGIALADGTAFGVQYHPEASPGPQDSNALFEEFAQKMRASR